MTGNDHLQPMKDALRIREEVAEFYRQILLKNIEDLRTCEGLRSQWRQEGAEARAGAKARTDILGENVCDDRKRRTVHTCDESTTTRDRVTKLDTFVACNLNATKVTITSGKTVVVAGATTIQRPIAGARYWNAIEEEALRRAVQKHGKGAWEKMRNDPEFRVLKRKTGVQIKDKWRNLLRFKSEFRDTTV